MDCHRSVSYQPLRLLGYPCRAHVKSKRGVASNDDGDKICHRCSGYKQSSSSLGKTEYLSHPIGNLTLNLDGHLIAATQVRVQSCSQHFRQHPDRSAAAVHPPHETGVGVTHSKRQDVVHELLMDIGELGGRYRDLAAAKVGPHFLRDGLPNRALADVLRVTKHVVEHRVRLGAKALPIAWIEGLVLISGRNKLRLPRLFLNWNLGLLLLFLRGGCLHATEKVQFGVRLPSRVGTGTYLSALAILDSWLSRNQNCCCDRGLA